MVYWVDSRTILCWIRNEKPWKQYVRNRVDEIRQLTSKRDWQHCPGNVNPADLPSRGMTGNEMVESSMWWNGPPFLCTSEDWPQDQPTIEANETALAELIKNPPEETHTLTSSEYTAEINLLNIINCDRFSNLNSMLRVTAYMLRFVNKIKRRLLRHVEDNEENDELKASTLEQAESLWIRTVQAKAFSSEISNVQKGLEVKPHRVDQFAWYFDENHVMRCRGIINNSSLQPESKHPILLPSNHPFVELLIRQNHEKVKHSAVNNTLTTIRKGFLILRGRQAVKCVLRRCVICKKLEGLSYPTSYSPDLPSIQVSDGLPFTHVGVDFASPVNIRENSASGSDSEKCYICLFTCVTTRAVHLELTRNLTVECFLLAFRRFTSRRGLAATLISDNAKTFRGASREIKKIVRSKEVLRYLANNSMVGWFLGTVDPKCQAVYQKNHREDDAEL